MKVEIISCKVYIAHDGKRFDNEEECIEHEMWLERTNRFAALKAKVGAIECLIDTYAPFGYSNADYEWYEYCWYRPKNYEEVAMLNSFFNVSIGQGEEIADIVGEWVGVEIGGGYDTYTGEEGTRAVGMLDSSNRILVDFYAALGYDVKIKKQESSVNIRDQALKNLWTKFTEVPINVETECIEVPFLHFPTGTSKEEIWQWFDIRYSKGVAALLYFE